MEDKKFHLGICMAGAITAGSYTAGVIDYLLETLARWQEQKDKNIEAKKNNQPLPFPDVPMYDVVIDVISGASAGGMCAAITTAMLAEGINYKDLAAGKSKMRQAWIDLDDGDVAEGTIKKMLETDDLEKDGLVSLLNAKVLSSISDKAILPLNKAIFPTYVDKNLDTILTLANLRGVQYDINFKSAGEDRKHSMSLHKDFMHFRHDSAADDQSDFLSLSFSNPDDIDLLRKSAVATGAFPIGLRSRHLSRSKNYVKNKADRTVGLAQAIENKTNVKVESITCDEEIYESMNIDGGTFNNEPFGEAERILNDKAKKKKDEDIGFETTNRSILMIDPFPCIEKKEPDDETNSTINYIVPRVIGALRAQSSFKTSDIIDAYSDNNYLKYLITPTKNKLPAFLCCSTLEAFGGFLYKDFREYDYQLGKRNAQRFLQKYFTLKYFPNDNTKNNPIHQNWSANAISDYKYEEAPGGQLYLPIIPDVQKKYLKLERVHITNKYPLSKLRELEKPLKARIRALISQAETLTSAKKKKEDTQVAKDWFKQNGIVRFLNSVGYIIAWPFTKIIIRIAKRRVAKTMYVSCIKWIINDLERAELLKED